MFKAFLIYLAVINLATFLLWGWDKRAAKKGNRRVPEKRLLWMAALLGAAGAWTGVQVFRHKTIKHSFRWKLIAITVLQVALVGYGIYWKLKGE
jgi:uncharacterized membrane protein YsdA (DUF1294 family)